MSLAALALEHKGNTLGVCVSCVKKEGDDNIYSCTQKAPAKWLCSIGRMVIPVHAETYRTLQARQFRETCPSRSDLRVTMRFRNKAASTTMPTRILYWAASPRDVHASTQASSAEYAYNKYTNMGVAVAKRDAEGRLEYCIDLRCPQPYVADDPESDASVMWSRHLHFVGVTKDHTINADTTQVHTLLIMPGTREHPLFDYECQPLFDPRKSMRPSVFVGFHDYWRAHCAGVVCINAVDHADYPPICTTDLVVTMPQNRVDSQKVEDTLLQAIHNSAKKHAHNMDLMLRLCSTTPASKKSKRSSRKASRRRARHREKTVFAEAQVRMLKRWPLLVYCVKPSCHAAAQLLFALDALGFHNVFYMPDGIEGARRQFAEIDAGHLARA